MGFLKKTTHRSRSEKDNDSVLIVYLELMGDLAIFTLVLKEYRRFFEKTGKKITVLISRNAFLGEALDGYDVMCVDWKSFWRHPLSAVKIILRLWGKFGMVINACTHQDLFWSDVIALSIGAAMTVRLKGEAFWESICARYFFERHLFSSMRRHYSIIVDGGSVFQGERCITNVLWYHVALFKSVCGFVPQLIVPSLSVSTNDFPHALSQEMIRRIQAGNVAVFVVGSGAAYRNWPVERFLEVARWLQRRGYAIIFVGSQDDARVYSSRIPTDPLFVDLMGSTSPSELVSLIRSADFIVSNETGPLHIAIALGKPSVCILGGGHFGRCSLYGVPGMNQWVYKERPCFCDNWECGVIARANNDASPCIDAVAIDAVVRGLEAMLPYCRGGSRKTNGEISFDAHLFKS
ncbi:MAG: glycosyltransferase family 9 protein [Candidatus Paceibacterota bacterium]